MKRTVWRVALGLVLVLTWALFATLQGRLLVTAFVAIVAARWWPFAPDARPRGRRALAILIALCLVGIAVLMPKRRASPEARVQAIFLDAHGKQVAMPWVPYLGNLVPESDLIRLSTLLAAVFPFPVGGAMLAELRDVPAWNNAFVREYRAFRDAGLDRHVPSVLLLQLLQDLGFYPGLTHFVLQRPASAIAKAPVVVFLHGYMGNFQFYSGYFSGLDDVAVVLPSTRSLVGHWRQGDLELLFDAMLPTLEAQTAIDRTRLHLIGLSNGGSGVNRALRSKSSAFASFTFLSTWVEAIPPGVSHDKPLVIVYGDRDGIASNNRSMASSLRDRGYNVRAHAFAGERHFVMIVRRDEVRKLLVPR